MKVRRKRRREGGRFEGCGWGAEWRLGGEVCVNRGESCVSMLFGRQDWLEAATKGADKAQTWLTGGDVLSRNEPAATPASRHKELPFLCVLGVRIYH